MVPFPQKVKTSLSFRYQIRDPDILKPAHLRTYSLKSVQSLLGNFFFVFLPVDNGCFDTFDKGHVKLIQWVKIARLFLHVMPKLFQFTSLNFLGKSTSV